MIKKRVCCLYRVSTDKQVDYDEKNEADIPMQRKACHRFADKMGWEIVHEEQEEGVSGHKIRAENRDKLQAIKELALKFTTIENTIGTNQNSDSMYFNELLNTVLELPQAEQNILLRQVANN